MTRGWRQVVVVTMLVSLTACRQDAAPQTPGRAPPDATSLDSSPESARPRIDAESNASHPLSDAARKQIGVTRVYDPAYVSLGYPGGDVDGARGVCTDVVIRALRTQGIDLQQAIHEDRIAHPSAYPLRWRDRAPDSNIDHRRVPNQMAWFSRQRWSRQIDRNPASYRAGDIVAWDLGGGVLHIGIVSDAVSARGTPLILHNIGHGTQQQDLLFDYTIIGHYRPGLTGTSSART